MDAFNGCSLVQLKKKNMLGKEQMIMQRNVFNSIREVNKLPKIINRL